MDARFSKVKVSIELASTISQLKAQLQQEFGCDFAFTILGNGIIISASNLVNGVVHPSTKDDGYIPFRKR